MHCLSIGLHQLFGKVYNDTLDMMLMKLAKTSLGRYLKVSKHVVTSDNMNTTTNNKQQTIDQLTSTAKFWERGFTPSKLGTHSLVVASNSLANVDLQTTLVHLWQLTEDILVCTCVSHVFRMCFACVSHVFRMCFACVFDQLCFVQLGIGGRWHKRWI